MSDLCERDNSNEDIWQVTERLICGGQEDEMSKRNWKWLTEIIEQRAYMSELVLKKLGKTFEG